MAAAAAQAPAGRTDASIAHAATAPTTWRATARIVWLGVPQAPGIKVALRVALASAGATTAAATTDARTARPTYSASGTGWGDGRRYRRHGGVE